MGLSYWSGAKYPDLQKKFPIVALGTTIDCLLEVYSSAWILSIVGESYFLVCSAVNDVPTSYCFLATERQSDDSELNCRAVALGL